MRAIISGKNIVMKKLQRPLLLIIAAILMAILVASGSLLWRYIESRQTANDGKGSGTTKAVVVSNVCTDDIVTQVSPALGANDISATRVVAEKIINNNNYYGDVNCGYIMTRYYLMTGDSDKAGEALDAMEAARAAGSEYSLAFNPPVMPIADLRTALQTSRALETETNKYENGTDDLNEVDKEWQKNN